MKGGNTVYAEAIVDVNVGHVHQIIFIDDINRWIIEFAAYLIIQDLHNRKELWNCLFKEFYRPFFQCFCQYRMVGVCAAVAYDFNGIIHFHAVFCSQQADQFRDDHSWMGVIDLDHSVVGKVIKSGTFGNGFV